jgi:uroporphyrinogen decarboxylase
MQTIPRDRALCALKHEVPETVPAYVRWIDFEKFGPFFQAADYGQLLERLGNTIVSFCPKYHKREVGPYGKFCHCLPEALWGAPEGFESTYTNSVARPFAAAESEADLERFDWPSGTEWDFSGLRDLLTQETRHARLSPSWMPVFSRLCQLFGMEQAMINLYEAPKLIEAALDRVDRFYTDFYARLLEVCGDRLEIFGLGDDFAGNDGMLFSPVLWRRLFKPLYAKWFGMAKAKGLYTFMHCCGNLRAVLPDLIDIGLDAWQTVQTHLPRQDAATLKAEFGRHLTFVGAIDTTNVLGSKTAAEVREHTRRQLELLGEGGGYICAPDHTIMPEVPGENLAALYDACRDFRKGGYTWLSQDEGVPAR